MSPEHQLCDNSKSQLINNNCDKLNHSPEVPRSNGFQEMSVMRKSAFIFSIVFAIVATVVFLWIIPDDVLPCVGKSDCSTEALTNEFQVDMPTDLEYTGNLLISPGTATAKSGIIMSFELKGNESVQGLVLVSGKVGTEVWRTVLPFHPVGMVDDTFNKTRFFVYGKDISDIAAIDITSGEVLWFGNTTYNATLLSVRVVSDLDGFGMADLIVASTENSSSIMVISGETGHALGILPVEPCSLSSDLFLTSSSNGSKLVYSCSNGSESGIYEESVERFYYVALSSGPRPYFEKIHKVAKSVVLRKVLKNGGRLLVSDTGHHVALMTELGRTVWEKNLKNDKVVGNVYEGLWKSANAVFLSLETHAGIKSVVLDAMTGAELWSSHDHSGTSNIASAVIRMPGSSSDLFLVTLLLLNADASGVIESLVVIDPQSNDLQLSILLVNKTAMCSKMQQSESCVSAAQTVISGDLQGDGTISTVVVVKSNSGTHIRKLDIAERMKKGVERTLAADGDSEMVKKRRRRSVEETINMATGDLYLV